MVALTEHFIHQTMLTGFYYVPQIKEPYYVFFSYIPFPIYRFADTKNLLQLAPSLCFLQENVVTRIGHMYLCSVLYPICCTVYGCTFYLASTINSCPSNLCNCYRPDSFGPYKLSCSMLFTSIPYGHLRFWVCIALFLDFGFTFSSWFILVQHTLIDSSMHMIIQ